MILIDDMLAAAFQYRDTELWKELTDSDVFGIFAYPMGKPDIVA